MDHVSPELAADCHPTPIARLLAERNALVNGAMAEVGMILWDSFGR